MPGLPKTMHLNAVHCWFEVFNCKGESHTYEVQADKQANTPPAKGNGDKTRGWRRLGGMTEAESMIKIDSNFLASEPGQSEGTSEEFLDIYPCFSGDEDEDVCSCIHNVSENYPFRAKSEYSLPGPNSNTFVWYVANECGIALKLPPTAVGGDFLDPVGPFRDPNGRYHGIFEEWRKNRKWRFVGGKWVKD